MIRRFALLLLFVAPLAACAPHPQPLPLPAALAGTYDPHNPFARIIRGELPAAKVYEDRDVLAFMDIHPVTTGHVLVISKTSHARNLLEMSPGELAKVMAVARRVARAGLIAFAPDGFDGVRLEQNNGSGQTVFHFHVHVIPHRRGEWRRVGSVEAVPLAELEAVAARLRATMRP